MRSLNSEGMEVGRKDLCSEVVELILLLLWEIGSLCFIVARYVREAEGLSFRILGLEI